MFRGAPRNPREAANSLLSRVRKWSAPKAWAAPPVKKAGGKKARADNTGPSDREDNRETGGDEDSELDGEGRD